MLKLGHDRSKSGHLMPNGNPFFFRRGPPVSAAPRFIDDSPAHNKVLALPFLGINSLLQLRRIRCHRIWPFQVTNGPWSSKILPQHVVRSIAGALTINRRGFMWIYILWWTYAPKKPSKVCRFAGSKFSDRNSGDILSSSKQPSHQFGDRSHQVASSIPDSTHFLSFFHTLQ
jgi:hypothetical protein